VARRLLQLGSYTRPFPPNVRRTTNPTIKCQSEGGISASNIGAVTGMRANGPVKDDGSAVETIRWIRFAKGAFQSRRACVEAVQAKYRRRQDPPTVRQRATGQAGHVDGTME
jgi:hypothetical protein